MGFLKKLTSIFYVKTTEKKEEVKIDNTRVQSIQTQNVNVQTQAQTQQFTQTTNMNQSNEYPVSYPSNFDELEILISKMRDSNKPIIISFAQASPDLVQRFVDILCGATLALNGTISDLPGNLHYFEPHKN